MSVINEKIYNFDYYVKKLPLYLRNSDGFVEHFRIWFDVLTSVVENSDQILDLINVFDSNYLTKINELDKSEDKNQSDILDKLGSIFNIKRNFSVTYIPEGQSNPITKQLSLNNKDFLLLIKAQIIKNYSDGSYIQMRKFYDDAKLKIYFYSDNPASVNVYLLNTPGSEDFNYSNDVLDMFYAGLLTIESMGITYVYSQQSYNDILVWANEDESLGNNEWDSGEWAI